MLLGKLPLSTSIIRRYRRDILRDLQRERIKIFLKELDGSRSQS